MMYSIRGALMFLVILSVAHIGRTFLYAAILEGIEALQYSHCASTQCLQDSDEIDGYCYTWHVVKNLPMVCTYNDSIKIEKGKKMRRCKRPRKRNGPLYYLRHLRSCAISNQSHCSASNQMGRRSIEGERFGVILPSGRFPSVFNHKSEYRIDKTSVLSRGPILSNARH